MSPKTVVSLLSYSESIPQGKMATFLKKFNHLKLYNIWEKISE